MSNLPPAAEMMARAAALVPQLRERSSNCEAARRCPDETVAAYRDAGLHRLLQPVRYGGHARGWDVLCDMAMTIAPGCAAQGWVLTIYGDHAQALGMFSKDAQDDVWGDAPDTLVAASLFGATGKARAAPDGARLTGRWGYLSGVDHASWAILGAPLDDGTGAAPDYRFFVVPKADGRVIDDWHVVGLAGTGSKSFELDDVFVPAHRAIAAREATEGRAHPSVRDPAPVYRMPRRSAGLALAAVAVGAAAGMVEEFSRAAAGRVSRGGSVTDDKWVQLQAAEAAAIVATARALVRDAAAATMTTLASGASLDVLRRSLNKRDSGHAVRLAREAAERLFAVAGGGGLRLETAIQRHFRDIHAAAAHSALRWEIAAAPYGRLALGLQPLDGTY